MEARSRFAAKIAGTRSKIFFRDLITFCILTLVAVALYGVTSFLFRSFESHRDELAVRWAERGRLALQQSKPEEAVNSLRAALSYTPDDHSYQLLLAEALADAGKTDEAMSYFQNLRDAQPGDGFVNLELARLARRKGNSQAAEDFYRESLVSNWQGDGVVRRRAARLELADYLIQQKNMDAARTELLIAAGNAPNTEEFDVLIGDRLQAADAVTDALKLYNKAIALNPKSRDALAKAGLAYKATGDYAKAKELLGRALSIRVRNDEEEKQNPMLTAAMADATRLEDLSLSRELSSTERTNHILAAAKIARARLEHCVEPIEANAAPVLPSLDERWKKLDLSRKALIADVSAQDTATTLIFDTERQTANVCGAPHGDDRLLLELAKGPEAHGSGH